MMKAVRVLLATSSKITLVITIPYNGSPMVITFKDKMGGEADYGGLATGTWSATAQKQ